jgi:uncharacterized protein
MNLPSTPTILLVPGLRDHVPEHWQTHLEAKIPGARSVPPLEANKLSCAARVAELDRALRSIDGPVLLVAHSAGVMITVHWAREHRREIAGALLVTPPDFERPLPDGYPARSTLEAQGWLPSPNARLPFPSVVCASRNDPLAQFNVVAAMAQNWGSRLVDLGDVGHLNPASGYGEWPRAEALIQELM